MHLFVDISSHGLGHLAITAPVLNALAKIVPDLRLTVRSLAPVAKLRQRIQIPFHLIAAASDFGYVMFDSTHIDLAASAAAYRAAHADWPARVAEESRFLAALQPDLVLSNISYLPLAGAAQAGIPAIGICSLNWADLFHHFFADQPWAPAIHAEMSSAYRSLQTFLQVTPGMAMNLPCAVQEVGPIALLGQRHELGLQDEKTVLLAMGGIAHRLPVENWPRLPGVRWLVPGEWGCRHPDALNMESFGLSFTNLLCSVDVVVTKPGYGTFTEAACNGTPVIYQRREDWPEQDCLIDWLQGNGHCVEIDVAALAQGLFSPSLQQLQDRAPPPLPFANGIAEAAARIAASFPGQIFSG